MYRTYIEGICFNTQPPEGGCFLGFVISVITFPVSTHSHPKVAARDSYLYLAIADIVSTHSHPKVAAFNHSKT